MLPRDAVQLVGAATLASAHDMPLAPPAQNTAPEMQAMAITLLGVSAARKVNTAIPNRPTMTGTLRLLIGERPRCIKRSVTQPAPMLPTTPHAYGIDDTNPVVLMLMWRCISR